VDGQRIEGNCNVQVQGVVGSSIHVNYNGNSSAVPLEPACVPPSAKLPSPARLVRAHSGVIPYVDRSGLLANLGDWIDVTKPLATHVIEGRGGAGKTRLAVKLCEDVQESNWLCGFLARIANQQMLDALVQTPTPRLVVIDYAENRAEQVEMLLPLLRAHATPEAPVRVLLLVRAGPAQAANWTERLANKNDAVDAILDDGEVQALEDTPLHTKDRESLFEAACDAVANRLALTDPPAPLPELERDVFANPLMIVSAAYLAAHGEEAPSTREELLDELLSHERRYWQESSAALDADLPLIERMVAIATLVNTDTEERAAELLQLIPDFTDASAERRRRLARWVAEQYPGPRWWNPLEPDIVGEYLVARSSTEDSTAVSGVLLNAKPEEMTRPLEVLARAAIDHPPLASALKTVFDRAFRRLCRIAVAQAERVTDLDLLYGTSTTAASALVSVIEAFELDSKVLSDVVTFLPSQPNVVLNDLAVSLTIKHVDQCRKQADPTALAMALNNASARLGEAGRHDEALAAIKESIKIYRPLAAKDPAANNPYLALALMNLSTTLVDLGRPKKALMAIEKSVEIWRPLVASDPVNYEAELATALINLSNLQATADRNEEALLTIDESIAIWQRPGVADPYTRTHYLAMSLNNRSNRLAVVGRMKEAVAAAEESVAIRRQSAADNSAAHAPDLAKALVNLSNHLAKVGRSKGAVAAIEESVAILRRLAASQPNAYKLSLIGALTQSAERLDEIGRTEEAETARREADELLSDSFRDVASMG
jgi:tetratricopeptide (TPR) repeat protein